MSGPERIRKKGLAHKEWEWNDEFTEDVSLNDILSEMARKIERLEGAYLSHQEIVLPDVD